MPECAKPMIRSLPSLLAAAFAFAAPALAAYEEPAHVVVAEYADFELRRYEPYVVVEAPMAADDSRSRNAAFRRLFDYISGDNAGSAEVAMTVPVTSGRGEKVAMTTPVTSGAGESGYVMRFMVPARYGLANTPRPTDPTLTVREMPEQWVAVRRWSGRSTLANHTRELARLREAVAAAGLVESGPTQFAVYNGPITPWFMRRNESWVPVAPRPQP
jgi:hypothetical protein